MGRFPALFSPINIGGVMLKNRVVMAPMAVNYAHLDGEVSERQIAYYEARARGGAGLIIVEAACVDTPAGRESYGQIRLLLAAGVKRLTGSHVVKTENHTVTVEDSNSRQEDLPADYIIAATGHEPNNDIYFKAQKLHASVHLMGDAFAVAGIREAILQGENQAAMLAQRENSGYRE